MREITNWQRIWNLFRKEGSGGTKDEGEFIPKGGNPAFLTNTYLIADLDWKLAWKGIGSLRPKTLDITSWDKKGADRIKKVFSIFDSTPWDNNANMIYMRRTLAQVTLKVI